MTATMRKVLSQERCYRPKTRQRFTGTRKKIRPQGNDTVWPSSPSRASSPSVTTSSNPSPGPNSSTS
jgi:hypothetical protein